MGNGQLHNVRFPFFLIQERQENVYLLENAGLERESYVYTNTGEAQRQLEQTGHPATEVSGFFFSSLLS